MEKLDPYFVVVIGGGAAGFFGAIALAEANPKKKVVLLEKNRQVLSKVRISGGGRCNVTHACFNPVELVKNYPRGSLALRGPFSKFQPEDTIAWFKKRGVELKVEEDGRMFPITDNSETIIQCFLQAAGDAHVDIRREQGVETIEKLDANFKLTLKDGSQIFSENVLVACGAGSKIIQSIKDLGHTIIPDVPSLFTFNVPDSPLLDISGVAVEHVKAEIVGANLKQEGPLLLTHWGFSGPAILKLSAWGARYLHDKGYKAELKINWLPTLSLDELKSILQAYKTKNPAKMIATDSPVELPKNLWKKLVTLAKISNEARWSYLSKQQEISLIKVLQSSIFNINGKSTYKEEFVTCGGIFLDEIDFKTMQSKKCKGLYFAGEVLDVDGVTGGFNFQNAWTTSWIAAQNITT